MRKFKVRLELSVEAEFTIVDGQSIEEYIKGIIPDVEIAAAYWDDRNEVEVKDVKIESHYVHFDPKQKCEEGKVSPKRSEGQRQRSSNGNNDSTTKTQ